MNNACPGCGAVYNVTSKDVGRRLKCKKCGSPMIITEQGIEPEGAAGSAVHAAAPAQVEVEHDAPIAAPRRRLNLGSMNTGGLGEMYKQHGSIFSTLLFGCGAFLVIFQLFMPLISLAKVEGRKANRDEAIREFLRKKKEIEDEKSDGNKATKQADLQKAHDDDLKYRDESIAAAQTASVTSLYWDYYFMMFGFLMVMIASLMFMMPDQPGVKRTVGAIVVTFQMVVVFMYFLGASMISSLAPLVARNVR